MDICQNAIDYRDLIPRENGFVFKFVKIENDFIHTYIEGELIKKANITSSMVIGKTLFDFLPEKHAKQKQDFYEMAWNGTRVNYEGTLAGVTYLTSLNPTIVNSRVVEVNGTAIDITMEKKNEIKIREMEKLSVVGELAAGIAHEIRNPLTSLIGFTQIIKESIDNVVLEEYLKIMMDELDRINTIVNEFMFISKPNETMVLKETNINTLIANVIKFMEPQSNLKSIKITSKSDSIITAFCDPNQVKQVLINLVQNAIEATMDYYNDIEITLENLNEDSYVIKISDKGTGISEERRKRLFEPFYTTKEKGTGLGLMVCKRIIDIHGGIITVDSKLGEGTVFRIQLPKKCRIEA